MPADTPPQTISRPSGNAAMPSACPVRVGAVSFLNTLPLIRGLTAPGEPAVDLVLAPPARLADLLHAGAIDVGLIPAVEHLRAGNYRLLTRTGICSRGPVDTVVLYGRRPLGQVAAIAADARSRTSAALAAVWSAQALGRRPDVIPTADAAADAMAGPAGRSADARPPADAVLVIGEDNWKVPRAGWAEMVDLGTAWTALTGLGFVYAGWSARPELPADVAGALERRLTAAKEAGVASIGAIAAEAADAAGVPAETIERYLTRNIRFDIDEPERRGMELFGRRCRELGLI